MFGWFDMEEFIDDFSWRTITEFIRHVTFVFIIALFVVLFVFHKNITELIQRAIAPSDFSDVFCAIIVFSLPLFLICHVIDAFDGKRISKKCGYNQSLIVDMMQRILYDITYIVFYFKHYIVLLLILVAFSVVGIISLL